MAVAPPLAASLQQRSMGSGRHQPLYLGRCKRLKQISPLVCMLLLNQRISTHGMQARTNGSDGAFMTGSEGCFYV
jgi:hypothetical protein